MTEYLAVTSTLGKTTSKYFFLKHYRDFENVYRNNRESGAYQKESHCRYGSHCPQHRPVNSDFAFDRSVAAVRQLRLNAQTFYAKLQSRTRFLRQIIPGPFTATCYEIPQRSVFTILACAPPDVINEVPWVAFSVEKYIAIRTFILVDNTSFVMKRLSRCTGY